MSLNTHYVVYSTCQSEQYVTKSKSHRSVVHGKATHLTGCGTWDQPGNGFPVLGAEGVEVSGCNQGLQNKVKGDTHTWWWLNSTHDCRSYTTILVLLQHQHPPAKIDKDMTKRAINHCHAGRNHKQKNCCISFFFLICGLLLSWGKLWLCLQSTSLHYNKVKHRTNCTQTVCHYMSLCWIMFTCNVLYSCKLYW